MELKLIRAFKLLKRRRNGDFQNLVCIGPGKLSRNWIKLDILCENEWFELRIATRACETDGSLGLASTLVSRICILHMS